MYLKPSGRVKSGPDGFKTISANKCGCQAAASRQLTVIACGPESTMQSAIRLTAILCQAIKEGGATNNMMQASSIL